MSPKQMFQTRRLDDRRRPDRFVVWAHGALKHKTAQVALRKAEMPRFTGCPIATRTEESWMATFASKIVGQALRMLSRDQPLR